MHVAGKVRALGGARDVFRRVVFSFDGQTRVVHETALDFWLVGDGEPVLVEVADARLLADGKRRSRSVGRSARGRARGAAAAAAAERTLEAAAASGAPRARSWARCASTEFILRDGDSVEIVGYKSRTIDPTIATRLERDTPFRATLKGGRNLPL